MDGPGIDAANPAAARGGDQADDDQAATFVGRYRLGTQVGESAAGEVYLADDPELRRVVELSLLTGDGAGDVAARIQRAAQVIHGNLVAVHDVGTADGRVFVVTEHVDGVPLDRWLAAAPRAAGTIAAVFRQAGAGLAAAHAAGVGHGALAAASIVVGVDGRVRVAGVGRSGIDDQRADQRAFCALLDAALGGAAVSPRLDRVRRHGADLASMDAVVAALDRVAPRRRRVAIGIAVAATALVGVAATAFWLTRPAAAPACSAAPARLAGVWDPARRALVERAFAASARPFAAETWTTVAASLDGWRDAFVAEHVEACRATRVRHEQAEDVLDRRMACLDRSARHVTSLVGRLAEAGEDAGVVDHAGAAIAAIPAPTGCAAAATPSRAPPPIPPGSEARVAALTDEATDLAVQHDLGRYAAVAERIPAVIASARELGYAPVLARLHFTHALALMDLSKPGALEAFDEAVIAGEAGHDDDNAVDATIIGAELLARAGKVDDAEVRARRAEVMLPRLADQPVVRARLSSRLRRARAEIADHRGQMTVALALLDAALAIDLSHNILGSVVATRAHRASILANLGRLNEAEVELAAMLAVAEPLYGPNHPIITRTLLNLGVLAQNRRALPEAEARLRRAMAIMAPDNPDRSSVGGMLAQILSETGRDAEASEELTRAIADLDARSGPDTQSGLQVRLQAAVILFDQDRFVEAEAALVALLARERRLFAPGHVHVLQTLGYLCRVRDRLDRPAEAIADCEAAIAAGATVESDPSVMSWLQASLAEVLVNTGRFDDAAAAYRRGIALTETENGQPEQLVDSLLGLASTYLEPRARRANAARDALPVIQRAAAILEALPADRPELGAPRWLAAKLMVEAGGDLGRARRLASQARAAFDANGSPEELPAIDAWLAEHPAR